MKYNKLYIALMTVALSLTACSDFLEKTPTSLTSGSYFKNETELQNFLGGAKSIITQADFYGGNYFYLAGGDDLEYFGPKSRTPQSGGLICNNATAASPLVGNFWTLLYSGINRTNVLLERTDEVPGITEAVKAQTKAEARFLRAFYYFNLVECWGSVPLRTISTQTVVGLSKARENKDDLYKFICNEMEEAAADLPTAASVGYNASEITKSAAWAMLARVYMFRAGEHFRDNTTADETDIKGWFAKANEYAKKVKNEGGHSLAPNYWDVFIDQCAGRINSTANEMIWQAEFAGNNTSDTQTEGRTGNLQGIPTPDLSKTTYTGKEDPGYSYAFFFCTPKLYEFYVANNDTKRMNWNIAPFKYVFQNGKPVTGRQFYKGKMAEVRNQYWDQSYSYGTGDTELTTLQNNYGLPAAKWRREYEPDKKDKNYTAIDFPIMRYSDVLLMIAECENEVNGAPTAEAYECINTVRRRAGIADLEQGLSQEGFRQAIKDERAMEFCYEMTRRFDLIRWGDFVKSMNELVPRAQAGDNWEDGNVNTYNYFKVSSAYNYFPLPTIETSVNDQIKQNNPGW